MQMKSISFLYAGGVLQFTRAMACPVVCVWNNHEDVMRTKRRIFTRRVEGLFRNLLQLTFSEVRTLFSKIENGMLYKCSDLVAVRRLVTLFMMVFRSCEEEYPTVN